MNVLFGFVPESDFDRAAPLVAAAAAETAPFAARLAGVHTFGHREDATLWLDPAGPDGDGEWAELRRALERRFPRCGGRRADGFTPHLTLGRSRDPQRVAAGIEGRLGEVATTVGELALLSRRGDEPMRVRATVALGTGEINWAVDPDDVPTANGPSTDAGGATRLLAGALGEGALHVVGSRRMGCALAGADLDLVAALPGAAVDMDEIRRRVTAALTALPGGASDVREVVGARVPGLRFTVGELGELGVDLAVVATGPLPTARAVERRAELGEAAAVALSAVSDAVAVRDAVGDRHDAFAGLAREVKTWARARGLDSAPFGGLPGLAWAVLAARTTGEAGSHVGGDDLLGQFFGTWAAWDWRVPVGLTTAVSGRGVTAPVTVLTPTEPIRNCTEQVGPGHRDLLVHELYRAWELLDSGAPRAALSAPPPLHRRHAAWAVATVATRRPDTAGRFPGPRTGAAHRPRNGRGAGRPRLAAAVRDGRGPRHVRDRPGHRPAGRHRARGDRGAVGPGSARRGRHMGAGRRRTDSALSGGSPRPATALPLPGLGVVAGRRGLACFEVVAGEVEVLAGDSSSGLVVA